MEHDPLDEGGHAEDANQKALPDMIEEQIIKGFSEELTREDYEEAIKEVEESLKQLTKASLTELKQFAKPHYLVEKTMQIVCTLRGFKSYNWSIAKELLARPQFKAELLQTRPRNVRAHDILRA